MNQVLHKVLPRSKSLKYTQYPCKRANGDRRGREKTYFHIWSTFQMVYVLEGKPCNVRACLLCSLESYPLAQNLPAETLSSLQTTEWGQNRTKITLSGKKDGLRPQREEGSLLHTRIHIHTFTASFGIKGSKDGWHLKAKEHWRSGLFPARNEFVGM